MTFENTMSGAAVGRRSSPYLQEQIDNRFLASNKLMSASENMDPIRTRQKVVAADFIGSKQRNDNIYRYRSVILWVFCLALFTAGIWLLKAPPTWYSFLVTTSRLANNFKAKEKLSVIRGTSLEGKTVESFRSHLDCFSESGQWVYDSTPRRLPWNAAGDPYASQCDGRFSAHPGHIAGEYADTVASQGGNWTVREELKWVWRTNHTCPMIPLDRDDICRLIGANGNILVVGDSINQLVQWSLLNNLLKNRNDPQVVSAVASCRVYQGFEVCSDVLGRGKGFKIGFVRNDRISPVTNMSKDTKKFFLEWPWLHLLVEWNIDILLLNRGAHFEEDDIYARSLQQIFSILHARHPNLLVFFRNTPPGHVNCSRYHGPLERRQQLSEDYNKDLHWREFERQNSIAKRIVDAAEYIYMDVDAMLSRRPDGHISSKDCLHYCIPGPLDAVVELFYNILKLIRS